MDSLAELTQPGPFGQRTPELGTYLGIFVSGRLVAMAAERLRLRGFAEASAVCTHSDFRGRGYRILIEQAPRWSQVLIRPSSITLSLIEVIGDDVLRASRGPTVGHRVPARSAPLTGGVRLSFQAHNVPLADKD